MKVIIHYKNSGLKARTSKDLLRAHDALESVLSMSLKSNPHFASVNSVSFSLILCGKAKIRGLNRTYRQIDKVTDVLSFPLHENLRFDKKVTQKNRGPVLPEVELGDLVICREKVISQSKEFNLTFEEEYIHLVIHGFLHLLGFDHEISLKEEKVMEKFEQELVLKVLKKYKKS
jgi:probable rRNA maturation factor